jgi:hypothetical protein
MAERADESRKLIAAYLASPAGAIANLSSKLDYDPAQIIELTESLKRINENPTNVTQDGMEISSVADKSGRKLVIISHPELQTEELRVVSAHKDKLPPEISGDEEAVKSLTEPYGPKVGLHTAHMMRILLIGTGALNEGNYQAIVEATQAGEDKPKMGFRAKDSMGAGILKTLRLAAVYGITPEDRSRYVVGIERPGQDRTEETWAELSKRFSRGTASFFVIGRVANVGRVRPQVAAPVSVA